MEKENKNKYQTSYAYTVKVNGEFESLDIVQEENAIDRNAIKISLFAERWRTPEETIELLKKAIIVIEKDFLTPK
jgi:hypothetical protein